MLPCLFLNCPSSFVFFVLSRKKMVESSSLGKSYGVSCSASSVSKQVFGLSDIICFMVFGFLPNTNSNGLFLLTAATVLRANSNQAKPAFPCSVTIVLSALNFSLSVLIRRSIFPFPRWSRTGHSMCLIKCSFQNCLNVPPRNMVAGSVLILFGIPN